MPSILSIENYKLPISPISKVFSVDLIFFIIIFEIYHDYNSKISFGNFSFIHLSFVDETMLKFSLMFYFSNNKFSWACSAYFNLWLDFSVLCWLHRFAIKKIPKNCLRFGNRRLCTSQRWFQKYNPFISISSGFLTKREYSRV